MRAEGKETCSVSRPQKREKEKAYSFFLKVWCPARSLGPVYMREKATRYRRRNGKGRGELFRSEERGKADFFFAPGLWVCRRRGELSCAAGRGNFLSFFLLFWKKDPMPVSPGGGSVFGGEIRLWNPYYRNEGEGGRGGRGYSFLPWGGGEWRLPNFVPLKKLGAWGRRKGFGCSCPGVTGGGRGEKGGGGLLLSGEGGGGGLARLLRCWWR